MKASHLIVTFIVVLIASCADVASVDVAIPPPEKVTAIEIVLPTAPAFNLTQRTEIDRLVGFLRDQCRWILSDAASRTGDATRRREYQILIRKADGSKQTVDVTETALLTRGYRNEISRRKAKTLDAFCQVGTIQLSPFHSPPSKS